LGVVINGWACFIIAREVFADRPRARLAAMIVSGAGLCGSLHLTVDPTFRLAYLYGGVSFYSFAILGSLLLPLALVPTAPPPRSAGGAPPPPRLPRPRGPR